VSVIVLITHYASGGQMMSFRPRPLLEKQRIFRSQEPDEARAFLRGKEFRFDVSRAVAKQLDVQINGLYLPNLYIGYIQYGSPAEIRSNPTRTDYWLQLPLREQIEFTVAHACIDCGPDRGAVSSPTNELRIRTKGSGARFNISLTASALTRQLAGLLGATPAVPLEFAPSIDLTVGYGRSLVQCLHMAVLDFEQAGAMPWDALTISQFEQFILCRLLLSHPNNYMEALRRREQPPAPRDLRRAIDYMHANLAEPITISDIAEGTGIAGRTLFQYFRHFKGTSPMRYLREQRFEKVRDALQRAEPKEGVATIAASWGFAHLGRFAVEYRRRYGETPSQTLLQRHSPHRGRR
jgi:AraC-like DNA-binding protein